MYIDPMHTADQNLMLHNLFHLELFYRLDKSRLFLDMFRLDHIDPSKHDRQSLELRIDIVTYSILRCWDRTLS